MTGKVAGFHQFCRASPTTPTTVIHGSEESAAPSLHLCPTGSLVGQKRFAMVRLMMATRALERLSASEKNRPAISGILRTEKYSRLMACRSAAGASLDSRAGRPWMVNRVFSLSTLLAGRLEVKAAPDTPGREATSRKAAWKKLPRFTCSG